MPEKIRVWDSAVRFFHWSQLLLLVALWYTGSEGYIAIHQLLAYSLAAIIICRLLWGVIGSQTARFRHFAASPVKAITYIRRPYPVVGHNPASSYMIFTLLILVILQLLSGLATFDNSYMSDGPLVAYLNSDWVKLASDFHTLNIDIIIGLSVIHAGFALWHSFRHDNVLATILTGRGSFDAPEPGFKPAWIYFVLLGLLLIVLWFWQGKTLFALM
ncbi:cytochrome b/b6 domain-containing protein [Arsukibacterium sp.]|uniref:cytochrome b/b6 domain-containing protein n=1 Tax=Arsukibacterium sp. TaxID=1977258 RepID=UPI002FDB8AEA